MCGSGRSWTLEFEILIEIGIIFTNHEIFFSNYLKCRNQFPSHAAQAVGGLGALLDSLFTCPGLGTGCPRMPNVRMRMRTGPQPSPPVRRPARVLSAASRRSEVTQVSGAGCRGEGGAVCSAAAPPLPCWVVCFAPRGGGGSLESLQGGAPPPPRAPLNQGAFRSQQWWLHPGSRRAPQKWSGIGASLAADFLAGTAVCLSLKLSPKLFAPCPGSLLCPSLRATALPGRPSSWPRSGFLHPRHPEASTSFAAAGSTAAGTGLQRPHS